MPYNKSKILIYKHADDDSFRFFPLPKLNDEHIESRTSSDGKPEVSFRVDLWNEHLKEAVIKHLDRPHEEVQVNIIPHNKVFLMTNKDPRRIYQLPAGETYDYDGAQSFDFRLVCKTQSNCDKVAEKMKQSPTEFRNLKVKFCKEDSCYEFPIKMVKSSA